MKAVLVSLAIWSVTVGIWYFLGWWPFAFIGVALVGYIVGVIHAFALDTLPWDDTPAPKESKSS